MDRYNLNDQWFITIIFEEICKWIRSNKLLNFLKDNVFKCFHKYKILNIKNEIGINLNWVCLNTELYELNI